MDSRKLTIESLRPLVESGPTPLFATISGAHLYGFASADSDVDIRGAFVLPLDSVLGLEHPKETFTVSEVKEDGLEVDWVAHDVHKFVTLMTKRNGYVLEQLFSPLVVLGGERHQELCELGRGCIIRQLYYHYRGFFHNQRKELEKKTTVKGLLYAYRVLLSGLWVLRQGSIEANLSHLLEFLPCEGVDELMTLKVEGTEKQELDEASLARHRQALEKLEEQLDAAFSESKLPDEVANRAALSDFVVRARKELGVG